ncbi:polysaccharide deacetylase family sporulation protein PdaB [Halalkalibacterium halodurans]|uniref:BH0243 protein n=2 Tax=Halalkalibacterium halodurans TaxID=86665 RepID=Q9JWQ7_HALH5|nr:polysaccharide deacetylase family sporulation protein PdaB [Halalkalibacterium halodurans]MED3647002.1 polysaccharide deacetylase family sporulation protein PdaB [Halalkalibacterium halodurans]MED4082836.1 polysaccharide deacetylase family sporulation protein PdaB [Halalkalibacterium halodurans]MED4083245.1 polysaccharide deacetylase family sporulation protein PdaB [Halalkalibacterium halodurans]MED4105226.1 polysaccharide deacetylase family sporulation protein PdaB [Halalkalibacterium halod
MKFFWVLRAKKIKQLTIILLTAFFCASLLYLERSHLMVFSTPEGPQAFHKAETDEKVAALTFNISWGEQRVKPIIDVLQSKKVEEATFFISASWAERHPELVELIQEAGYHIGSHGYQYKNYTTWEDEKIRKDLRQSQQVISSITGEKPTLLRPPNGDFDKRVLNLAESYDYTVVHWSINSRDYENPGVDAIVRQVVDHISPGDIVLMHASDSAKQTHKALPIIIDQLKGKGYHFRSIEELMADAHPTHDEIK